MKIEFLPRINSHIMSKPVTLADLASALKPIIDAVTTMREENSSRNTQVNEMHGMITALSVKLDGQEVYLDNLAANAATKPVKKTPSRAKPKKAEVAPPKRKPSDSDADLSDSDADVPPKKASNDSDSDSDVATKPTVESDADEPPKKPTRKVVDSDSDSDESVSSTSSKKAAVKIAPKATKAPSKAAVKAAPVRANKMTIFKEEFKRDPSKFDAMLSKKDRGAIVADNEDKWATLQGDALLNDKARVYYALFSTNYSDVLDDLKAKHVG